MRLFSTRREDARALADAMKRADLLLVVCFCAAWCHTCDEIRAALERIARRDAANIYVWLDIEDDAMLAGDIDVEDFPTFAVYRGGSPLFFGASPPQEGVIARTLAALTSSGVQPASAPEAVAALPGALAKQARSLAN